MTYVPVRTIARHGAGSVHAEAAGAVVHGLALGAFVRVRTVTAAGSEAHTAAVP